MELLRTWAANTGQWCKDVAAAWDRFWFTPTDPATVGLVRIIAGSILLFIHLACLPQFMDLVGPHAWIDTQATQQIAGLIDTVPVPSGDSLLESIWNPYQRWSMNRWHRFSLWLLVQDPFWMWIIEVFFLACMACYVVGFCSRPMAVIVWVAHLSLVTRGYSVWFGMDAILLFILFYLMFAPTGAALSVDRLIARHRALKKGGRLDALLEPAPSWGANVALRMIQIHMGIVYLCSALSKLQGPAWWNGMATWISMNTQEFALLDMRWLARYDPLWQWVCGLGTLATIVFELIFIFLVWLKGWRPVMLVGAVLLHFGIGLTMGLFGFGVVMMAGVSAFLLPHEVRWCVQVIFRGRAGYRYVYNRADKAQERVARLIATFDVFRQVELVEMHEARKTSASPGTLLAPDGSTHRDMAVFWKLTGPLRTLWLTAPVAYWLFRTHISNATTPGSPSETREEDAAPMKKAV